MNRIYNLEHIYEDNEKDEIKFIGLFLTKKDALDAIKMLKNKPWFKEYPVECFQISEIKIGRIWWQEGFISQEEAMKTK